MMLRSRANVVSSFTATKGAMIDETYAVFAAWDLALTKRENLEHLRRLNYVGARSSSWLEQVIKVLNRRFEPAGRDRALVVLAQSGFPREEWKPLLLWHIARDEFLLRDFLQSWLFSVYQSGAFRVRPEEVRAYLRSIGSRGGEAEHDWTENSIKRVAAGLLKMATDFNLLRGSSLKEFTSYHLPERSFLYLLHAVRDERQSAGAVITASDWRLFLMRADDIEQEILRLHQYRRLEYHVAGSLIQLELPYSSALECAERMPS